ncbi:MAG TPA: YqjK family protein [Candidatus Eisenbacteria bacterium]|nr:YqjK family protein [Candidatus Eisenbacteria bacterium]
MARRELLIARSEALRDEIGAGFQGVAGTIEGAERVLSVIGFLRRHVPKLAAGVGLATLLIGPVRVSHWVFGARRIWRTVRGILAFRFQ